MFVGSWVVADVAFPRINELVIHGVLEIDHARTNLGSYKNFTLEVSSLVIKGGRLIAGWEDNR